MALNRLGQPEQRLVVYSDISSCLLPISPGQLRPGVYCQHVKIDVHTVT